MINHNTQTFSQQLFRKNTTSSVLCHREILILQRKNKRETCNHHTSGILPGR